MGHNLKKRKLPVNHPSVGDEVYRTSSSFMDPDLKQCYGFTDPTQTERLNLFRFKNFKEK
jgi:hypothetical protein